MRVFLLPTIAALLFVSGCVDHARMQPQPSEWSRNMTAVDEPPPPPSPSQIEVYRDMYRLCLAKREPELDDGISDAGTVATVLRTSCPDEYDGLLRAMTSGASMSGAVVAGVQQGTQSLALRVVLEERAKRVKH